MYGWLNGRNVRFGADDGAGGGGDPTPPAGGAGNAPNPPAGQKPGGQQQPAPTGDGTGTPGGSNAGSGDGEKKFTQSELEAIVKDRLDRLQQKAAVEAEKAKKAADDASLAEQAKWQELAEQREKSIGELTPKAELADRLVALMNTQLETEIAKFPAEIKAMDPGTDNLEARMEWIEKARPVVAKLSEQGRAPGNPRPPKPAGAAQPKPDENRRPTVRL